MRMNLTSRCTVRRAYRTAIVCAALSACSGSQVDEVLDVSCASQPYRDQRLPDKSELVLIPGFATEDVQRLVEGR